MRTTQENWVILNRGTPPAIVMGLSSSASDWVDLELAERDAIPILQRFSGGGTVFVDQNTIFATFIFNSDEIGLSPFPAPILQWTAEFYKQALAIPGFSLSENDYTIGDRKVGGNAQYLQKKRWLHHSSFLHSFSPSCMNYLLHPKRQPDYRKKREHTEFLTSLSPYLTKEEFCERITAHLKMLFQVELRLEHLS